MVRTVGAPLGLPAARTMGLQLHSVWRYSPLMGLSRMKGCPVSGNFSLCTFPYEVLVVLWVGTS